MKKTFLSLLLACLCALGYSQPNITNLVFHSHASLFGLYEISFQLDPYDNPYDPEVIDVYAEMTGPDGRVTRVNGFYYEDYQFSKVKNVEKAQPARDGDGWRIRFTPDREGAWSFVLHARDKNGETVLNSIGDVAFKVHFESVNNAKGFITKANTRYLKREVIEKGKRQSHSFFPIGPNIAWYLCASYYDFSTPKGIYDYERYTDSLLGNANYMRVWMNRYQYLSLYGPEYTQTDDGQPRVYFDHTLNQKDAAEFDHILQTAAEKGIAVMPCIFTYGDFHQPATYAEDNPSDWRNNPFNTLLKLQKPSDFFTDAKAKKITRNLLRYIAARWGYATNIVAWELWNEVNNMDLNNLSQAQFQTIVVRWHEEMAGYLRSQDPFHHLITTSMGGTKGWEPLNETLYRSMDFAQLHNYQDIHKAQSKSQFSQILYNISNEERKLYPTLPVFVGEFAFGQTTAKKKYVDHDPRGIDLHNSLWSSLFSGTAGTASFWYWDVLRTCGLFSRTKPMLVFSQNLPLLSDSFTPHTTGYVSRNTLVFPNNIATYYLVNAAQDTLYGWCQDTAFCYQSLRHLTSKKLVQGHFDPDNVRDPEGYVYTLDKEKRPRPSSRDNSITLPIENQQVGTQYVVRWYDAETGLEMVRERTTAIVTQDRRRNKQLVIQFPSSVRDVKNRRINNTFGDAVFSVTKQVVNPAEKPSVNPTVNPTVKPSVSPSKKTTPVRVSRRQ